MIEVLERESDPMQSSAKPSSTSLIKNAEWQAQTQPANNIDSKINQGRSSNMELTERTDLPEKMGQSSGQLNPMSTMKTQKAIGEIKILEDSVKKQSTKAKN